MAELPLAAVERVIRRAGAERVSKSAAEELSKVLEEKALEIASEANTLTEHAGRKTVRDEDIRLAIRKD
ncbi:histone [candidate division MSBL1 archaeon SCGC-AAA259I09]|uniref:Histone n=1 Tax=candidate division MSBL1 archaeon SCGC-AAA259I09 TaxID=1698267 RepID=A0A133USZ1_9EURY|nr:histone [candidate division MSBL1 archaeon SCGC-AAA259I09]